MNDLLNMGGYGAYVWPAWGIATLILTALILVSIRGLRTRERELARLENEMPRRRRRSKDSRTPDAPEDE